MRVKPEFSPAKEQAGPISRDDLELSAPYVAPRTVLEIQLADIWRQVFDLDRVGVQDDFFDLAGDSLHGAAIMTEVKRIYGISPGPTILLTSPTIEALARVVGNEAAAAYSSVLFPLRAEGSKSPLFLVHGRLGHIFMAPAFTANLDPDRPVYLFQARGLNGRDSPHTSVEDMAEDYIRAMRKLRPEGPYALGSFCAGSHIAVAMAGILRDQGEELHPLIVIDPPVSLPSKEGRIDREISLTRIHRILRRMSVNGVFFGKHGHGYMRGLVYDFLSWRRGNRAGRDDGSFDRPMLKKPVGGEQERQYRRAAQGWANRKEKGMSGFDVNEPEAFEAASWTSYHLANALRQHEPEPFDGTVEAIMSEDRAAWAADRDYYLRSLANEVTIYAVGPYHRMLFKEHLPEVAQRINEILRDAS